jgi:hypothetical protein
VPDSSISNLISWHAPFGESKMADTLPARRGQLMHRSGILILIKTTLATAPIYTVISLELPPWMQNAMERIILWTGTDEVQNGKCLVAWSRVQRPLHMGGSGVLDFKLLGHALRLRWL